MACKAGDRFGISTSTVLGRSPMRSSDLTVIFVISDLMPRTLSCLRQVKPAIMPATWVPWPS